MSKGERTFVRGLTSEHYSLKDHRRAVLATERVRDPSVVTENASSPGHSGDPTQTRNSWRIGPGDDPFLTQTVNVHFPEIPVGKANHGHGHQNEACFYILQGRGHEIHDDERYDWSAGDLVMVHTDSVHRHWNDGDELVRAVVFKPKSTWMFMGLFQQGRRAPFDDDAFGPREDWGRIWTPDAEGRKKVVTPADAPWELTRDGHVRILTSPARTDVRCFAMDIYEQHVAAGSRSAKHWHMADEVLYVVSGSGYSLHWEVEAEIDERYYARVAKEPSRHDIKAGDTLYIPTNHVHQHVADRDEPLVFLSAQNRIFRTLGYDNVVYLEDAPEYVRGEQPAGQLATV